MYLVGSFMVELYFLNYSFNKGKYGTHCWLLTQKHEELNLVWMVIWQPHASLPATIWGEGMWSYFRQYSARRSLLSASENDSPPLVPDKGISYTRTSPLALALSHLPGMLSFEGTFLLGWVAICPHRATANKWKKQNRKRERASIPLSHGIASRTNNLQISHKQ